VNPGPVERRVVKSPLAGIFADRGAARRVAVALVLVVALGGYYAWWALHLTSGYRWAMEDPISRDGAELVFPLWTVTAVSDPDHYAISKVVTGVPVVGDAHDLKVGDTVSVIGTFSGDDHAVHVTMRELHVLRRWKEALGYVGFAWVVIAAPFAFRVQGRRLVERG
jgi:hypothetical protein